MLRIGGLRDALGSVKSVVAMLGVLGPAFSPVLMGWFLQSGVSFAALLPGCIVLSAAACALSFAAQAWMRRADPMDVVENPARCG